MVIIHDCILRQIAPWNIRPTYYHNFQVQTGHSLTFGWVEATLGPAAVLGVVVHEHVVRDGEEVPLDRRVQRHDHLPFNVIQRRCAIPPSTLIFLLLIFSLEINVKIRQINVIYSRNSGECHPWNRRMSRGLPAFFRQFWLHFRKNLRKNLKENGRKTPFKSPRYLQFTADVV